MQRPPLRQGDLDLPPQRPRGIRRRRQRRTAAQDPARGRLHRLALRPSRADGHRTRGHRGGAGHLSVRQQPPRSAPAAHRSARAGGQIPPVVDRTADHIAWLEAKFGRYPFSVYGCHIYDGYSDALENQTLSLFSTDWFTPDAAGRPRYETTMVHELVHQWYGDSVTPADWQQAWLNEGPAVHYAALYGEERGWSVLDDKMRAAYAGLDKIRAQDGPPGRPRELGGTNIYDGDALVLYALRLRIGDKRFARVMRCGRSASRTAM
ncbi:M1 family aminopeptidase [Streptomyces albus]